MAFIIFASYSQCWRVPFTPVGYYAVDHLRTNFCFDWFVFQESLLDGRPQDLETGVKHQGNILQETLNSVHICCQKYTTLNKQMSLIYVTVKIREVNDYKYAKGPVSILNF